MLKLETYEGTPASLAGGGLAYMVHYNSATTQLAYVVLTDHINMSDSPSAILNRPRDNSLVF